MQSAAFKPQPRRVNQIKTLKIDMYAEAGTEAADIYIYIYIYIQINKQSKHTAEGVDPQHADCIQGFCLALYRLQVDSWPRTIGFDQDCARLFVDSFFFRMAFKGPNIVNHPGEDRVL